MDVFTELRLRRAAGDLDEDQHEQALERVTALPPAETWRDFVWRVALAVGTGAVLAGVVYLFAWNWSGLGRFTKLALGSGTVLVSAAFAQAAGLDGLPGRLAGAASCGFAGALFVLYTQIYQTGADPWELFAAFAAVTVPFVIATRLPVVGAAGLVAGQLAVLLGWMQLHPWEQAGWAWFSLVWVLWNVPLVLALHRRWPNGTVSRTASILGIGLPAAFAIGAILDRHDRPAALIAFGLAFVGAHLPRRDLFPVAWAVFCGTAVVATGVAHETADLLDDWMFLLLAILVGTLGALGSMWLRFLQQRPR